MAEDIKYDLEIDFSLMTPGIGKISNLGLNLNSTTSSYKIKIHFLQMRHSHV